MRHRRETLGLKHENPSFSLALNRKRSSDEYYVLSTTLQEIGQHRVKVNFQVFLYGK